MSDRNENGSNNQSQAAYGNSNDAQQSRGERFDEQQGGGRGDDTVSAAEGGDPSADNELDAAADKLLSDQQAHQDRGQGAIEEEQA